MSVALLAACRGATGATVASPDELSESSRWVAAKFAGVQAEPPRPTGLIVLANNDPVQKNQRAGRPLRIGDTPYVRGLYCHAVSEVVVRLPLPARKLSAVIGVDSNDQTRPGRGSVVFAVDAAQREIFRSAVIREGMPPVSVEVELPDTAEFVLRVADGGDGIGCDQADWADARVVLANGQTVWLGDLPVVDAAVPTYSTEPPFAFVYAGRSSRDLLEGWNVSRQARPLDDRRTEHTLAYADPDTGLVVRCVAIQYHDFPTVEWTVYFQNAGTRDTPILSEIRSLETSFQRTSGAEFVLHHQIGSPCLAEDYRPIATPLAPRQTQTISAAGGRPTNSDLPYFNLAWQDQGVILVVGWPGQWSAQFVRDDAQGVEIRAGQELTHLVLHPGEQIRTPLSVVQFWMGDRIRAQNIWRRWMLAHNLPRPGGQLPPVQMAACSSHQFGEMIHADSASQKLFIDRYLAERLPLDYWWMDAGWYWNQSGWPNVGTWQVDTNRFPGGLRPICDHAHARGVKTIVWFEPERVTPGTWLYDQHPEWLLGKDGETKLLNLGNDQARQWLTDHVDQLLTEQGIDLYRQDFNMDPLSFWRANDAAGSSGSDGNPPCGGLPGLLGRTAPSSSRDANRLLCLRWSPQRPGDTAPCGAAVAERLHHGAGRQPVPHVWHRVLVSLPRHRQRIG